MSSKVMFQRAERRKAKLRCGIAGPSGSGKSTLVTEILYRAMARHLYRSRLVPGIW